MLNTTEEVQLAFEKALRDANKLNHEYLTLEHLTFAVLCVEEFSVSLQGMEVDVDDVKTSLENYLVNDCAEITISETIKVKRTRAVERVMQRAFAQSIFSHRDKVGLADIILSILHEKHCTAAYYLIQAGITKEKIANYMFNDLLDQDVDGGNSALERYSDNLTQLAVENKIDPVIGRNEEIESIALALGRRNKNNIMLVGDPGVGKTAIAEGLANKIANKDVPEFLHDYEVYSLRIPALLAGTRYRGEFEERMELLLAELNQKDNLILYIDEAHMINGAGAGNSENPNDLANILKPALSKGKIKVIASTTWEEYRKYFEKDSALMRRFQRVTVDEPDESTTAEILLGIKKYYENFHKIKIGKQAIKRAIDLSVKYQHDKKLPDKAIDLLDQACARFKLKTDVRKKVVTIDSIDYEMSKVLKLPLEQIQEKETETLAKLESNMKSKVYGQDTAIEQIVDKICVARAGLKDRNKPIGSFVFMGPTGTGKTETAQQLADNLGVKLVRFDMSEFQEAHSVSKLIGSPPGYVGYSEGSGKLINKIQESPNCVLLLDEIEKAHPDISQILLQIMDNGKITGSDGKTVDMTNCVLIITTNLGAADTEKSTIGFSSEENKVYKKDAFKKFFAPEFRNRLDKVIVFDYLDTTVVEQIVDKFIASLRESLVPKKVSIELDNAAVNYLVTKGYDKNMGARPLDRLINDKIKTPISKEILFGKLQSGGKVLVSAGKDINITYGEIND